MTRLLRSGTFWFTVLAVKLLVTGVVFSVVFWDWVHPNTPAEASRSTTLRNIGLLIGGVLALVFAVWRGWVAERQAVAARRQADTAQRRLQYERYERGTEMLGSDVLSVRLGGIYALNRLAEEFPEQYHIQIMELLCAFVRHPSSEDRTAELQGETAVDVKAKDTQISAPTSLREDIQAVMTKIGSRDEQRIRLESEEEFRLNLRRVDLRGASLQDANLSYADLTRAKLSRVDFCNADLSHTILKYADLSWHPKSPEDTDFAIASALLEEQEPHGTILFETDLSEADLSGANFSNAVMPYANLTGSQLFGTTLSDADLSQAFFSRDGKKPAMGMTQADLDEACADASGGPSLDGAIDAETARPLVWRGKPCPRNEKYRGPESPL